MKKSYLIALMFLSLTWIVNAKIRTKEEAELIAVSFFSQNSSTLQKAPSKFEKIQFVDRNIKKANGSTSNSLYVFNRSKNQGFVIVSGDDCAQTILGYADTGNFDYNYLPDGLKYWLEMYENEINSISISNQVSNVNVSNTTLNKSASNSASYVAPLLGNIKWNQGSPYNLMCPVINIGTGERAATGCVATGMAQIMKYHQWPVSATGSNSYTTATNKISLNLDFSKTTYDWANMTDTYNASSSEAQKSAVSTLMYHCGVAVNMDYGTESFANFADMGNAMITNFGFDPNLEQIFRDFYSRNEIVNKLKADINLARPVLVGGQSSSGGHFFVIDGYDTNDLFHVNWGWGGSSNGYFQISALNPPSSGDVTSGYNTNQQMYFGIQKPTQSSIPTYHINAGGAPISSVSSMVRNASTTITINNIWNYGLNIFNGNIGLALFKDGSLYSVVKNYTISDLKSGYGWGTFNMASFSIPTQILNGQYKLYPVYKAGSANDWSIVRTRVGTPNYLNVNVTTDNIEFITESGFGPQLSLNNLTINGNLYQNKTGNFSVNVTNSGEEYNSIICVFIQSTTQPEVSQMIIGKTNIIKNETKTYDLSGSVTLGPGSYNVSVRYDPTNNTSSNYTMLQIGNTQTVTIQSTPTGVADLELKSLISFTNNNFVDKNNAILRAEIKNKSGFFDNKMIAFIFLPSGGSSLGYIGYQSVVFDSNEQKTITFSGNIDLNPGSYKTVVYYRNESNSWTKLAPKDFGVLNFNLVDNSTGNILPEKIENLKLFPIPADDKIYFMSDDVTKKVELFQMNGQLINRIAPNNSGIIGVDISDLKTGNYLIKVTTFSGKLKVNKFI